LGKSQSSKKLLKESLQDLNIPEAYGKNQSVLQDRAVRNLLYNTIKGLVLNKLVKE
jgi:hypothetical protein